MPTKPALFPQHGWRIPVGAGAEGDTGVAPWRAFLPEEETPPTDPVALYRLFVTDPQGYARMRARHPEMPARPASPGPMPLGTPQGELPSLSGGPVSPQAQPFTWDLPKRLGEERDALQHAPYKLPFDLAGLAGEAVNNVSRYVPGVLAAPYQYEQERGADFGQRLGEVAGQVRQGNIGAIPQALGELGHYLTTAHPQTSGGVQPEAHDQWGDRQRPPLRSPFDPAEALAREHWYLPGALDLIPTMVGPGPAAIGLLGKGVRAATLATGRELFGAAQVEQLAHSLPNAMAQQITKTALNPKFRMGVFGISAGTGALAPAGVEEGEQPTPEQRFMGAAVGGFVGLAGPIALAASAQIGTKGLEAAEDLARLPHLPVEEFTPEGVAKAASTSKLDQFHAQWRAALATPLGKPAPVSVPTTEGTYEGTPNYLRGPVGRAIDGLREAWIDQLARINTLQRHIDRFLPRQDTTDIYDKLQSLRQVESTTLDTIKTLGDPILARHGINGLERLDWVEWRSLEARLHTVAAGKPDPGAVFADTGEAQAALDDLNKRLGVKWGLSPQRIQERYGAAAREYEGAIHGPILRRLEQAGLRPTPEEAQSETPVEHIFHVAGLFDNLNANGQTLSIPTRAGIREFQDAVQRGAVPPVFTPEEEFKALIQANALATRNEALNMLAKVREDAPEGAGLKHLFLERPQTGTRLEANVSRQFGRLGFVDQSTGQYRELLAEKHLADALLGQNAWTMLKVPGVARKTSMLFQRGVTAWNPFFWPAHFARTLLTVFEKAPPGAADTPWQAAGLMFRYWLPMSLGLILDEPARWLAEHAGHPAVEGLDEGLAGTMRHLWNGIADPLSDVLSGYPGVRAAREFRAHGMGLGGYSKYLLGEQGYRELLGAREASVPGTIGQVLSYPAKAGEAVTYFFDQSPRMALAMYLIHHGTSTEQAVHLAEAAGVDFSKAGTVVRVLSQLFPLLNAREQGWLTGVGALWDDPERVLNKFGWMIGMPTIGLWQINRQAMGELYDSLEPNEKRENWIVPLFGHWKDDKGKTHPLYIRIPKTPIAQVLAAPLEYFLDTVYHVKSGERADAAAGIPEGGKNLAPRERSEQSMADMWLTDLGRMLPTELTGYRVTDPVSQVTGIAGLNPMIGVVQELYANKDHFTGRPIIPEEQRLLPPQYQFDQRTSDSAKLVAKALDLADVQLPWGGKLEASPKGMEYAAQSLLGMPATMAIHGMDLLLPQFRKLGLVAPDEFDPKTWSDLGLPDSVPPEVAWQYLDAQHAQDNRPWLTKFLPRLFGAGGSADTVTARASMIGPQEEEIWKQTTAYQREYQLEAVKNHDDLDKLAQEIVQGKHPDITHDDWKEIEHNASQRLQGVRQGLAEHYKLALTDPKERQAFIAKLPGYSVDDYTSRLPQLPPGVDPGQIAQQVLAAGQGLNPWQRYEQQQIAWQQVSRQLGLPTDVVRSHVGAWMANKVLPALPVPNVAIEELRDAYLHPQGTDALSTPTEIAQARRALVDSTAQQWGVQPQTVTEWLNARFQDPFATTPMQRSRETAASLAFDAHDPQQFPEYVDPQGHPRGNPTDWQSWDYALLRAQATGTPMSELPPQIQALDMAKRAAEAKRLRAMLDDPRYPQYERWYGLGRKMPVDLWQQYETGQIPKYKQGTPQDWREWDTLIKVYNLLSPLDPQKARLEPMVQRLRSLQTKHWANVLQLDIDNAQQGQVS